MINRVEKVELLISTMNQDSFELLDRMRVQSDATVINQCNTESVCEFMYNEHRITWVNTTERGLSRSRNMAISYAQNEICLLCDDDEILHDKYPVIIEEAFKKREEATLIVFNINKINGHEKEKLFTNISKIPRHKSYGSVHISFRRKKIIESNIVFNTKFGTGSGMYLMGEESLFFNQVHRNKLVCYTYPAVIADVDYGNSSWFRGYNERYFYDIGAFLKASHPILCHILMFYYPIRLHRKSEISIFRMLCKIEQGIEGYIKGRSYGNEKN